MNEDKKLQTTVAFRCPKDLADRLEKMAEKGDIPRSKLILNMVETMLGYLEVTEKVGVLHLAMLIRDAGDNLKDVAKKWRKKQNISDLT
ncbi:MAG: ribbon-helix-helix protein, CopG family [Deltaproteobacteria bacterium]|nr:ribbon-helix-helix protein, CopG family [Deltaproteobacteria bacterium]MBN2845298.1 ribbon-helix-helix protein, CopG family [Deltaproteobacteria bacterium]